MVICCLCLKESEDVTDIFGDLDDRPPNVAIVIAKHFWFEPLKDDPAFTAICIICWRKLMDFHEFYEMVETAHQRNSRPEIVTVKTETPALDTKDEPNNEAFEEMDEVPFSANMMATNKLTSMTLIADELSYSRQSVDDNDDHSFDKGDMCFKDESDDSDPFDDTEMEANNDDIPLSKLLGLSKSSTKDKNLCETAVQENVAQKPRRGRKKKMKTESNIDESSNHKTRKTKSKEKTVKDIEEESAYKNKMKSFDQEISQYMGLHCDVCNIAVENFAGIKNHMRLEHNIDNGYVKCCDKKFHKRANLLYHVRHHVDPNCYRCEECNQTFSDYQSLRNHLNVKHQKEEDKIYKCTECPKKFARKYLLEQHRTFKHKDHKQCKMCNRRYKTIEELEEHNKEPCAVGIMCDICAKVIFGPGAFKRHQLEHDGSQSHKVQCDMCGSWHRDKYALRKHKRRHLEPKTPHVCDICQKVSPSREAMVSHKKYAHRSDRIFECEFCHKSFKRPISLREHITTHTGAVLYTCPHCPKTFNSNANMHSHRKNAHPIEFEEARKRRKRIGYLGDQKSVTTCTETETNVQQSITQNYSTSTKVGSNDPIPYNNNDDNKVTP
ncbi:transcription factor grauzone [Musca domestica]|uniref:Transcription factor grauzone n=1 Tax=Musca domestica TaxID=7370 RepID=A0A1I8NBR3_MUSDO|nr:transcription factor grauzone [Musca domestica]